MRTHAYIFTVWVVSCDDIVRDCSLRQTLERDLQMRSSWTLKMKYSSALIRRWTLAEQHYLQRNRSTAMCAHTHTDTACTSFFFSRLSVLPKEYLFICISLCLQILIPDYH